MTLSTNIKIGKIKTVNDIFWFEENYFPITDIETKIIKIAYDITKYKEP